MIVATEVIGVVLQGSRIESDRLLLDATRHSLAFGRID